MKKMILTLLIMAFAAPLLKAQGEDTLWSINLLSGALAIKFSPDEKFFYVVTSSGVEKHDSETGDSISSFKGKSLGDLYARFSPDGSKLICASYFSISVWDVEKEELMWSKSVYDMDTTYGIPYTSFTFGGSLNLSYDGNYAFIPTLMKSDSNNFLLYNVNEQKIEKVFDIKGELFETAASLDGKYFVTSSSESKYKTNTATLWDAVSMLPIRKIDIQER